MKQRFFNFKALEYLGLMTQIGLLIVASILIGFVVGHYLDKWLKTGILMTVIFLISGVAAGFLNVYRLVKRIEEQKKGS